MKILNVAYDVTLDGSEEADLKGRSLIVTDEIAADLYGYEAGSETTPENIGLVKAIIEGLETLEGNTAGEIRSIG